MSTVKNHWHSVVKYEILVSCAPTKHNEAVIGNRVAEHSTNVPVFLPARWRQKNCFLLQWVIGGPASGHWAIIAARIAHGLEEEFGPVILTTTAGSQIYVNPG